MGRILEAKAVISAEDRTGKVLDGIASKFRNVGKSAKVSVEIDRMSKSLKAAQDSLKGIEDYRGKRSGYYTARNEMLAARKAADDMARTLSSGAKPTRAQEAALRRLEAAADAATAAFERQKRATLDARAGLSKGGVAIGSLISEQNRLAKAIDQTSAAMQRQARTEAQATRTGALAKDLRRAKLAERQERIEAAASVIRERRLQRREALGTVAGGAGVLAAHKGKKIGLETVSSAADFDIATRKQEVFTDIGTQDQTDLLAQAKRIGQETQFSNIDVVKAQTAAMQGLPSGFAPKLKAEVAQGIVENVRNYATLMETDLKDGAETIRSYLQATGKDISSKEKALSEANKATNQIVKMAKLGGMNGEDASQFVKFAAASSTSAGVTTDTMLTLGALARRGGLRGDEAGVAMRSMAGKIVSPTRDGIAALNAAGIKHSDYVRMPDRLSTDALEGQFQNTIGKGFTPAIRNKIDAINIDKALIADRGKYIEAVTTAVGPMLGKTKKGAVRASDSAKAAKAAGAFYKVSGQSVDADGLLDAAMSKQMSLPQLNAWLTDKHGGKGAITQRQWDEFKSSREQIRTAGDDPDWAKKKADTVMAGLGGAVENLKGSWENFILQIGLANTGLIKFTADGLGGLIDGFSKLSPEMQQGVSIAGGGAALAGGAFGAYTIAKNLLGFGPLTGSATALTASAAELSAAAMLLKGSGPAAAGAAAATAAAPAAAGLTFGLGGVAILGGAIAGGALDMMTPGTNAGVFGGDSSLTQTFKALRAERAGGGFEAPGGGERVLPGAPRGTGYTSTYEHSRGAFSDFLYGKAKASMTLPGFGSGNGIGGKTIPVEVVSLPTGGDRSGQATALNNTLDKAATTSATAANGGKPLEATVKPDQITAKVESLPPVTGEATISLDPQRVIIDLNSDMLNARIEGAVSRKTATMALSSGGARPGAVTMPGAASPPGAK